jgi:hypothetical protein
MAQLQAADTVSIQLEAVSPELPLLAEKDSKLDSRIKDIGSQMVSSRNYRIPMQVSLPGAYGLVSIDGGDFPRGGKPKFDVGTVTPLATCVPFEYTLESKVTGSGGNVSTVDVITRSLAQCMDALKNNRDKALQTDGTGKVATVTSVAALVITLNATPFGARLLAIGQTVQVFNANAVRGSCTITDIGQGLGNTQTITVDAVPGGTIGGDFIRVNGVATGTPIFLNGIPVFHSTSTAGSLLGIARSNSYVVANGVNASSASLTRPMIRLAENQVRQRLGDDAVQQLVVHTHPSQVQSYDEMGWDIQVQQLGADGKATGFDPLIPARTKGRTMAGHELIENIHADQTRVDFLNFAVWGKVKWGKGTFWYDVEGNKTFPIPAAAGGGWSSGVIAFLLDALQFYANNMASLTSITSLAVPAGN